MSTTSIFIRLKIIWKRNLHMSSEINHIILKIYENSKCNEWRDNLYWIEDYLEKSTRGVELMKHVELKKHILKNPHALRRTKSPW